MNEFLIARGHDGPAREGSYSMGEVAITTPVLIGPSQADSLVLRYNTFGRTEPLNGTPMIVAISGFKDTPLDSLRDNDSILLPTLVGNEILGLEAGKMLLELQRSFLENRKIPSARAIVRVPASLVRASFIEEMHHFGQMGVKAAAFRFAGNMGPSDYRMLDLRSHMPRNWFALAIGRIEPYHLPLL
ncbi:MAG: hypothetical protein ACXABY_27560, partial [Candidatus Thorarchaeota archaeon]